MSIRCLPWGCLTRKLVLGVFVLSSLKATVGCTNSSIANGAARHPPPQCPPNSSHSNFQNSKNTNDMTRTDLLAQMQTGLSHAEKLQTEVKDLRPLDEQALTGVAAIAIILFADLGGGTISRVGEAMSQMKPCMPGLFLQRPTLPSEIKWPIDRLTGKPIDNPWSEDAKGSQDDISKAQSLIDELYPQLGSMMRARAKVGTSFATIHGEELERQRIEAVATLVYDPFAHAKNPWVHRDREAQIVIENSNSYMAAFLKNSALPAVANVYGPGSWVNRSGQARVESLSPAFAGILQRAAMRHAAWATAALTAIDDDIQRAQQAREKALKALGDM